MGDDRDERKMFSTKPYNYQNRLIMWSITVSKNEIVDLPSLTTIVGSSQNFEYFGYVYLNSTIRMTH